MLKEFKFHHIGYATNSIADTSSIYIAAGYAASNIIKDHIQQAKICFLSKDANPCIELIEPLHEVSSINKILKKIGVAPYHICYEVKDITMAFNELIETKGYIPLFRPVEAVAFNNRLICYLYKKEIGYIELINK
ncbi:MAG: VOC family protein [Dysgonamonadaceae bacterium]|jgi:methylmalonyl-CoA/ethylmalonyl-CoA epimerase|nr:VOC family protein [Dysgonamonadaceae bacterium]